MTALALCNQQFFDGKMCNFANIAGLNNLEATTITDPSTNKPVKCFLHKMESESLFFSPKLQEIVEKILNSAPAKKLLDEALTNGPLSILQGNKYNAPAGGAWQVETRTIFVNMGESEHRKLGHLLFEISDSLNSSMQQELSDKSRQGLVSREDYVKLWERIQFNTAETFSAAVKECIDRHQWSHETDLRIPVLLQKRNTWEKFWELMKDSEHANFYRADWDVMVRPKYCENYPKAKECISAHGFSKTRETVIKI